MSYKKVNLTTANNSANVYFNGRGFIHAEGDFGTGDVKLKAVYREFDNGLSEVSSTSIIDAINGTTVNNVEVPPGEYQMILEDSSGADIDVFYIDQVNRVKTS